MRKEWQRKTRRYDFAWLPYRLRAAIEEELVEKEDVG